MEALALYRGLLRHAGRMQNYNFRAHALRRVRVSFREARLLPAAQAAARYQAGLGDLALMKRQAAISALFPEPESIMQQR